MGLFRSKKKSASARDGRVEADASGEQSGEVRWRAEDPGPEQTAYLQSMRDLLPRFHEPIGGVTPGRDRPAVDRLSACDEVIRFWHQLPEEERPPDEPFIDISAVSLGDALNEVLGTEWKIVTDSFGTSLALWGRLGEDAPMIVSPFSMMAKGFHHARDGMVEQTFASLVKKLGEMRDTDG